MMDEAMRPARLFTLAAAAFAILAPLWIVEKRRPALYLQTGRFAIPDSLATLGAAAICGIFALLYFGCDRLLRIKLDRRFSLANFLLIVVPFGALLLELHSIHPNLGIEPVSPGIKLLLITEFIGTICLLIGCLLFVINFSRTLVRILRTRE
jgi:hypothetical protein